MKSGIVNINLKLIGLSLAAVGVMASCTPIEVSKEDYKQNAIDQCSEQPTKTDYNNCVNRAKMEAEEFDIETDKKLKPQ